MRFKKRLLSVVLSLPLRECGLKHSIHLLHLHLIRVTPLAGVWIETANFAEHERNGGVTPLAGVWIETADQDIPAPGLSSHSPCGSVD